MIFFSSRRRHTRFDCDWSSDVCSSDLTTSALVSEPRPARIGAAFCPRYPDARSEEHTSELQSQSNLVCRLLLEKKKKQMLAFSHELVQAAAKLFIAVAAVGALDTSGPS